LIVDVRPNGRRLASNGALVTSYTSSTMSRRSAARWAATRPDASTSDSALNTRSYYWRSPQARPGTRSRLSYCAVCFCLIYYGIANVAALRMPRAAKLYHDSIPLIILTGLVLLAAGVLVRWLVRRNS
jgi:hypothetical protein